MILLGVNIDHAATLRQARYRKNERNCGQMVEPDPVILATYAEKAGADGITVHLREDRRHIQESDVRRIRENIQTRLNLEMACTQEMVDFAVEIKPETVCLVPENREEVSTEGGLDVTRHFHRIFDIVKTMTANGIQTSLFIDPDGGQIEAAAKVKSPLIELHTGSWANAYYSSNREREFKRLIDGAELAYDLGLTVNAGHGINYVNAKDIATVPHLHELNIGHSIISRAVFSGITEAVQTMKQLLAKKN